MDIDELRASNPYALKRGGQFTEALSAYAEQYASALEASNEYIAQVCFDQMLDIRLIEFMRDKSVFKNVNHLKMTAGNKLRQELQHLDLGDDKFKYHFDQAWSKFARKGGRFSVNKQHLIKSRRSTSKPGEESGIGPR